ncbi:hypothetical protein RM780_09955 [Streptomyces sp. DSM 44917]|uniref:Endonuclease/exonuclease/phosphatase domain-containing protein n=1 Tax=Streptomyces boetiae TaxID=3075541 RepID=A0ABU2L758_9ACTN|nr:hypothetical protein [Streptomyces sp. DSM 44917]MDT0307286.1 hypothetical protein [Streptomyces sp. DSM 44917]
MPGQRFIRIVTSNFELNGGGDMGKWERMHALLKSLNPQMLMRQELVGCSRNTRAGSRLWEASCRALGMAGWLAHGKEATALYADPTVVEGLEQWPDTGPDWWLDPAVVTLRLTGTKIPIIAASAHLRYDSPAKREAEADWLTRLNDQHSTRVEGQEGTPTALPAAVAMDSNSYPEEGTPGDLPLPQPAQIPNAPHRAHRFRKRGGVWVPDTVPDEKLRLAELEDAARHLAEAKGMTEALAATMPASETHGPATRIDRVYLSCVLLPAVHQIEVIDVGDLSDHHTVVLTLDLGVLRDILNDLALFTLAA